MASFPGYPDPFGADPAPVPPEPPPEPASPAVPAPVAPPVTPPPSARRGAGLSIVITGAATIAGALVGGLYGAGAGLFGMGAARNLARAQRLWTSTDAAERGEAAKSATLGALGILIGGYLGYRAYRKEAK